MATRKRDEDEVLEREVSSELTEKASHRGRVSLNPLSFEEALAGLLQVEPPESKAKPSQERKAAKKAKKRT